MHFEPWIWLICPLFFFGMMILCMLFSRRRGGWSCCFPSEYRDSHSQRIRKLEDEIRRLKERG